jgi:hypothetical protein
MFSAWTNQDDAEFYSDAMEGAVRLKLRRALRFVQEPLLLFRSTNDHVQTASFDSTIVA